MQVEAFLAELEGLSHRARTQRMIALGRRAQEPEVAALLDALDAGDAYARRLALSLIGNCCDGAQAVEAAKLAWELKREDEVIRALYRYGKRQPIGDFLFWLKGEGDPDAIIDLIPFAAEPVVRCCRLR